MARWIRLLLMCCIVSIHAQSDWVNLGPYGGEFDAMAIDQKKPNYLYIGTRNGQIYRSTNSGQTWSFLNALDGSISKLVVDSSDGLRMFVGLRDRSNYSRVFYSTDGGLHWENNSLLSYYNEEIKDFIINPANNLQMHLVTANRSVPSVNGGKSFVGNGPYYNGSFNSLAYDPHDPSNVMYAAGHDEDFDLAVFQSTRNAWSNVHAYQYMQPGWKIGKIHAENTFIAAVYILMGNTDSTKILRSTDQGQTWTTVFEDDVAMYQGNFRIGQYTWLHRGKNSNEHVVASQNGVLKTNDGGLTWFRMRDGLNNNLVSVRGGTFVRSPQDTSVFYCNYDKAPTKLTITPYGYVANVSQSIGFTAQEIKKVYHSINTYVYAETRTRDLIYSDNFGQDFYSYGLSLAPGDEIVGGHGYFVTKRGNYLQTQGSSLGNITFPPGTDSVVAVIGEDVYASGFYESYEFGLTQSVMNSVASGFFMAKYDFGLGSVAMYTPSTLPDIAVSAPMTSLSIAFRSYQRDTVDIYVASSMGIATTYFVDGAFGSWQTITNFDGSFVVNKIEFRETEAFIWAKAPGGDRLFGGHRENVNSNFTINELFIQFSGTEFGQSEVHTIHTGVDGYYMIRNRVDFGANGAEYSRPLYKAGFGDNPHWTEISTKDLGKFNIENVITEYRFDQNAVVIYAAANNGIWTLKQTASIEIDTITTFASTSALLDSSFARVTYRNSGTAFSYIERFEITDDAEQSFSIADKSITDENGILFLDIRAETDFSVMFKPTSKGLKTANLKSYYTVRASNGSDSTIVATTRLVGIGKTSQIGTNLKNDTLNIKGVLLNASKAQTFTLTNTGEDILTINDIYFVKQEAFSLVSVNGSDSVSLDVVPGRTLALSINFTPQAAQSYTDTLIVESTAFAANNTPSPKHRIVIKGIGSSIQISNLDNLGAALNQALTIEVSLSQIEASDVTGILRYRKSGDGSSGYKSKTMAPAALQTGTSSRFTTTIPQEDITQNGLEFYVEFTSSSSVSPIQYPENGEFEPQVVSVTIPNPGLSSSGYVSLPGGTDKKAFQLMSFPLNLTNKTVGGAFTPSNMGEAGVKGDWQVYRYDNDLSKFISSSDPDITFGNIESGKSYLLVSRKPKTINSGAGKTVKKEDAHVTIQPGWNMIANPYAFSINWSDVANFNDNVELTNIVVLQNGRFKYVDEVDVYNLKLEPWKGYMYYSPEENGTFTINYPAINSDNASALQKKEIRTTVDKNGYRLQLTLHDDGEDMVFEAGASEDAQDGADGHDKRALPMLMKDEVSLHWLHADRKLQTDIRAVSPEGHIYTFEVTTGADRRTVSLSYSATNLPEGFSARIVEMSTGMVQTGETQSVIVQSGKPKMYKLLIGTEAFIAKAQAEIIPSQFSLAQNYPNPFNPSTTLRFGLPETSSVKITIYNMLGQQVRTLVKQVMPAASHALLWDGTNDFGQRVASGVYVYRLEATGLGSNKVFSQTRKMTLIK
ncbi:T9SS type A sorting domain-containing protein [bacterium]|nr:T9SS type A sorting domain-containing protein [bacterium]NUN46729.1 T9SS type A sorting domain-containing protein [bacterium]